MIDVASLSGIGGGVYVAARGATWAAVGGIGWAASTLRTGLPVAGRIVAMRSAGLAYGTVGIGGLAQIGAGSLLAEQSYNLERQALTVVGAQASKWDFLPVVATVNAWTEAAGACRS